MAAQSGKLTNGYEMANKPEIKKRKNTWWKRRGKERKTKQQHFLNSRQQHGRATDAHELPHTKKE